MSVNSRKSPAKLLMEKEMFIANQLGIKYSAFSTDPKSFIIMLGAYLQKVKELSLSYNQTKKQYGFVTDVEGRRYLTLSHCINFQLGLVEEVYKFLKEKES